MKKTKPFLCVACKKIFYTGENEMPITTSNGHICSQACAITDFHKRIEEAELPFQPQPHLFSDELVDKDAKDGTSMGGGG